MLDRKLTVAIKNKIQPIHWHDILEVDFVIRGEMQVVRNNKLFKVSAGEMMVLNRDDVHSIDSESEDLLYVQIHFNTYYFQQYVPDIWTAFFYCSPEENDAISVNLKDEMKSHISKIVKLMSELNSNIDAERKIKYYAIDLLSTLKMGFINTNRDAEYEVNDEQIKRVWKAIDYMYDNYNRKLPLHEVAQQVFVSDDYLTKLFKKITTRNFEEFLGFIRAEMSIRLLLSTDLSITNVAYECGFSAPRYYNAAFIKAYECTPIEYRKNNKNNFMLEKQIAVDDIWYDNDIDKKTVNGLLKQYELEIALNNTSEEIVIQIDKLQECGQIITTPVSVSVKNNNIWNYNLQKAVAGIGMPCFKIAKNIYVWAERDSVKILVINQDFNNKEYELKITGLDPKEKYIYCREKSPDIPESIMKLVKKGVLSKLDKDFISGIFSMTYEYGELIGDESAYMDIELENEHLSKIVIQKI